MKSRTTLRIMLLLLLACCAVFVPGAAALVAQAPANATGSAGQQGFGAGGQAGGQVTLRFSWWGGEDRHRATLEAIDLYQKLNPRVKILSEYGSADGYLQKMKIQLSASAAPDVMQIDQTWLDELSSKGDYFVDLSKQPGFDASTFDAGFLREFCTFDGKLVGAPTGLNAQLLLVNKTAAQKMGVNLANLKYWDGLIAEGRKLHARDRNYYLLSHDTQSFMGEVVLGYVKQLTGRFLYSDDYKINFTKTDASRAFRWLADAVASGTLEAPGEAALYSMKGEQNPRWFKQQLIGVIDWASNYSRYILKDAEYEFLLPPTMPGAKTGASTMRPSQELTVNARSTNIAEAVRFLNWFLNDKDAAVILGDSRSIPASSVARKAAADAGKINRQTSDALAYATSSRKLVDSALTYNTQIVEIENDLGMKVEFGSMSPEQAADELIKRINAKFQQFKAAEQG